MDYLKWSTLENTLGVKGNDFSKMGSRLSVRTLPRTFIYFKHAKAAILEGINNPLAIFSAGSIATGLYRFMTDLYFSDRHQKALFRIILA